MEEKKERGKTGFAYGCVGQANLWKVSKQGVNRAQDQYRMEFLFLEARYSVFVVGVNSSAMLFNEKN